MEFENFISSKFKISQRKTSCCGVRPWASHYLFLVLMVCNLRQDTFIDYFGVWPWTNHGFTYDLFLCSLGQDTFIYYLVAFTELWPGDGQIHVETFIWVAKLGLLLVLGHMEIIKIW
jgi:hypothetical protein